MGQPNGSDGTGLARRNSCSGHAIRPGLSAVLSERGLRFGPIHPGAQRRHCCAHHPMRLDLYVRIRGDVSKARRLRRGRGFDRRVKPGPAEARHQVCLPEASPENRPAKKTAGEVCGEKNSGQPANGLVVRAQAGLSCAMRRGTNGPPVRRRGPWLLPVSGAESPRERASCSTCRPPGSGNMPSLRP